MRKRMLTWLLAVAMIGTSLAPSTSMTALAASSEEPDTVVTAEEAQEANVEDTEEEVTEEVFDEETTEDVEEESVVEEETLQEDEEETLVYDEVTVDETLDESNISEGDYVYGTVNMSYADFYYGEINDIEPDGSDDVTPVSEDPVDAAGYNEEGMYDAATFATPKSILFTEQKWKTQKGTYYEAIEEDGDVVGGKILGLKAVDVAINKNLLEKAKADSSASVLNKKIAEIKWKADSEVPQSYKVLNSNGTYSKFVETASTQTALTGAIHTNYNGDDNWWEIDKTFNVEKDETILGGLLEWKEDPANANSKVYRAGLKHEENIWKANVIGWGVGPEANGIYGGKVGWQRFSGISGKYVTKLTLIVKNDETGKVTYQNAVSDEGLISGLIPSGVVEEDGSQPYNIKIGSYKIEADTIYVDITCDVPLKADGTPAADYGLEGAWPAVTSKSAGTKGIEWTEEDLGGGRKVFHVEIPRSEYGVGRLEFIAEPDEESGYAEIYKWGTIESGLTSKEIYIQNNKLVVDSELFTVDNYRNNAYQAITVENSEGSVQTFTTGDSRTDYSLMSALINSDGTFNANAQFGRKNIFDTSEGDGSYHVTMYVSGYPVVEGDLVMGETQLEINTAKYDKTYSDPSFKFDVTTDGKLTYKSGNTRVVQVNNNTGMATTSGIGTTTVTITAQKAGFYMPISKTVEVTVTQGTQTAMKVSDVTTTMNAEPFTLSIGRVYGKATVTYSCDNDELASIDSKGKITLVKDKIGTAKITVSTAEVATYLPWSKEITLTVVKPDAELTLGGETLYMETADKPANVSYTKSVDDVLKVTSDQPQIAKAELDGDSIKITPLAAGVAVITAAIDETDLHKEISKTIQVTVVEDREDQVITAEDVTKKIDDAAFVFGVSVKGEDTKLTYASDNNDVASIAADGKVTIKGIGEATVTVKALENDKYRAAEKTVKVKVEKGDQLIQASDVNKTYGDPVFKLAVTVKDKAALTYTSTNPEVAEIAEDGSVTIKAAGSTSIEISAAATDKYHASTEAKKILLTVAKKAQKITFDEDAVELQLGSSVVIPYTTESGNIPSLAMNPSDIAEAEITEDGIKVNALKNGEASLTIAAAGNDNYEMAAYVVPVVVTGEKLDQKIKVREGDEITVRLGAGKFSLGATALGNIPLNYKCDNTNIATVSDKGFVTIKKAGTVKITITAPSTDLYKSAKRVVTLIIKKKLQTLTLAKYELVVGKEGLNKKVSIRYITPRYVSLQSAVSTNEAVATATVDSLDVNITPVGYGTATITVLLPGNDEYEPITKSITVTVNKQTQTVSVEPESITKTYGDEPFKIEASTDGPGALSYKSEDESIATVSEDGVVTIVGSGETNIIVTAAETDEFIQASAKVALSVNKQEQSVTASNVSKVYGSKAFNLNAKSSAQAKMTYASSNSKVATINSKGAITLKGCGEATITIKAAETALYKAASKKITVTVKPAKASIKKAASSKKATMDVTWKKDAKVSGYSLEYSTDKTFKKSVKKVTVSQNATVKKTIKGLKSKKKYYVRVRSYYKAGKKTLYGAYSKVLSVKAK